MIPRITEVHPLTNYRILVKFNDGAKGEVDIARALNFKGVFAKLRDVDFFNRVKVGSSSRTVEWPGELDLDPVMLYHRATGKPIDWILDAPEPETKKTARKTAKKARVYA